MRRFRGPPSSKDLHLFGTGVLPYTTSTFLSRPAPIRLCRAAWLLRKPQARGAKTTTRRKIVDLPQGAIQAEPLPDLPAENEPQYPTVIQGARDNMAKFANCVVLTRVGNFYELYFSQAEEYGPLLNLKVAYKKTTLGPVAMAGFPFFQLDRFLKTLVQDLQKYVAISEEFPASVGGKVKSGGLLFDRRVNRVVTPGTLIDEKFLDPYENNYLLSVHPESVASDEEATDESEGLQQQKPEQQIGLAWLDLSTGDFFTQTASRSSLASALTRIGPREVILPSDASADIESEIQQIVGHAHGLLTLHQERSDFVSMASWNDMLESPVVAEPRFSMPEKLAGHRLLDYVGDRLQGLQLRLQPPKQRELHEILSIDRNSMRGLEILETSRDGLGKGSLFHSVNKTLTKSGARLLRDRLTSPSASLDEINHRLDLVTTFFDGEELRENLEFHLKRTFDVQRLVQKFALNKGDADDMLSLASAISETEATYELLNAHVRAMKSSTHESSIHALEPLLARFELAGPAELSQRIANAIDEEGLQAQHRIEEDEAVRVAAQAQEVILGSAPEELDTLPQKVRTRSKVAQAKAEEPDNEEPWIMRRDASTALSRLHKDLDNLKQERLALQQSLREGLASSTLTLKTTPGLGHIAHVRAVNGLNAEKLAELHARQVSASKSTKTFYIPVWTQLASRVDQTRLYIRNEENRLFAQLRERVIQNLVKLRRNASIMAELDVACSFASVAKSDAQPWVRPTLTKTAGTTIIAGRHPTVSLALEALGRSFIPNDLSLTVSSAGADAGERIALLTGPNMGGKSTYLRSMALIHLLAQAGSYVPAQHAALGLVDRLFSRIGSADDLYRGESTFMVEMLETAQILRHATPRSFVIMDEVGRGTTAEDGIAVGYAALHHLYGVNGCRTLFATHFHALADMTAPWPGLGCYCTDVREDAVGGGSWSFVHRVRRGVNRQSQALRVARLAGMPESALAVAAGVLAQAETQTQTQTPKLTQTRTPNETQTQTKKEMQTRTPNETQSETQGVWPGDKREDVSEATEHEHVHIQDLVEELEQRRALAA